MKTYQMFVGDEHGLRDGKNPINKVSRGRTGFEAVYDQEFVSEILRRRSTLKMSGRRLSKAAGFSPGYISLIETGRIPSTESSREKIRAALDRLEVESKNK